MAKRSPLPMDIHVGSRVRNARLLVGMSQSELGTRIGVTFQQVQKYEKGANRLGASRLTQVADVLKKPVGWFFEDAPSGNGKPPKDAPVDYIKQLGQTRPGHDLAEAFLCIRDDALRHSILVSARAAAAVCDRGYAQRHASSKAA